MSLFPHPQIIEVVRPVSAQSVNKCVRQSVTARTRSEAVKAMPAAWQFAQTKAAIVLKIVLCRGKIFHS
jgi:hypothetical protein